MSRSTTCVVCLLTIGASLGAQAPLDTGAVLDSVAREVVRLGARHGEVVWPGYRPDTIPLAFVLPTHGNFLFNWRGSLPAGYTAVPTLPGAAWRDDRALGAASTGTQIAGRPVAQVAIGSFQALDGASLVATAFHEAFHVFERVSARTGRRFGGNENAMLSSSYPLFDVESEAAFALEGTILDAAMSAANVDRKRELAQQFVAVRRARHRQLPADYVEFDQMSEMNEGLANYALARALRLIVDEAPPAWKQSAYRQIKSMQGQLADLTGAENLSLRFRYYQTGPAQALLLDDLMGSRWKEQLIADNATLEDLLGSASGIDATAEHALIRAQQVFDATKVRATATQRIARLRTSRLAKVDSLLSAPGIRLVLVADSLPGRDFNSCGFDPQNLLPVTRTVQIQMRWWKPCAGGPTYAEFNVPSVHDEAAGTVSAIIGPESDVRMTTGGQPITLRDGETLHDIKLFKLEASRTSVDAVRVDLTRDGNTVTIRPKRPQ